MNIIKSATRNKLGDILRDLMILYDMTPTEHESIDIKKLAEMIAAKWTYDKTDKIPWSQAYDMCIV